MQGYKIQSKIFESIPSTFQEEELNVGGGGYFHGILIYHQMSGIVLQVML